MVVQAMHEPFDPLLAFRPYPAGHDVQSFEPVPTQLAQLGSQTGGALALQPSTTSYSQLGESLLPQLLESQAAQSSLEHVTSALQAPASRLYPPKH